jgi:hypothetical protein
MRSNDFFIQPSDIANDLAHSAPAKGCVVLQHRVVHSKKSGDVRKFQCSEIQRKEYTLSRSVSLRPNARKKGLFAMHPNIIQPWSEPLFEQHAVVGRSLSRPTTSSKAPVVRMRPASGADAVSSGGECGVLLHA